MKSASAMYFPRISDTPGRNDYECVCPANVDLICSNIFMGEKENQIIDYEWMFDFPVPVNFIMWRLIHELYTHISELPRLCGYVRFRFFQSGNISWKLYTDRILQLCTVLRYSRQSYSQRNSSDSRTYRCYGRCSVWNQASDQRHCLYGRGSGNSLRTCGYLLWKPF